MLPHMFVLVRALPHHQYLGYSFILGRRWTDHFLASLESRCSACLCLPKNNLRHLVHSTMEPLNNGAFEP